MRLEQVAGVRYAAGAYQGRSVAAMIEVRRELGDAQVIGSQRHDDVARNRVMPKLVVFPDDARRTEGFFGHVSPFCNTGHSRADAWRKRVGFLWSVLERTGALVCLLKDFLREFRQRMSPHLPLVRARGRVPHIADVALLQFVGEI